MGKIYTDEVLRIAAGEVGYKEKATNASLDSPTANAGSGNYTKYARDMWAAGFYNGNKQGYAWCAVFFDWCVYMASGEDAATAKKALCYTGPYGAGCAMSVTYYKEAGRFYTADPRPGDQIFFGTSNASHTGMVEKVKDGKVYTIEGNADNMVKRRSYALDNSTIIGYGRPRYDGNVTPEPEDDFPFVDVPDGKYYTDAVKWAYDNGLVSGIDETHFGPKDPVKRCDLQVELKKLYDLIKGGG